MSEDTTNADIEKRFAPIPKGPTMLSGAASTRKL